MRPIKLKIKGINSFIEEQSIDFEKLTDRGLFGIFGPTGSGKSTILDGITLALYGELARKSSNFINTNCSEANVSFEFQISGAKTKIYKVDRQYKRDKKSGNIRSGSAKLIDLKSGDILANKVNEVSKACRDIIGLGIEDFTRTVVLPQGKFSEFLKLEGKQRRDMLERLFNLHQYGDDLARKLSQTIAKEKSENQFLLGQKESLGDVSEEILNEKQEELELLSKNMKDLKEEYEKFLIEYEKSKDIWNLQLEVKEYEKRKEAILKREDEIKEKEAKVENAENANNIIPTINDFEDTSNSIKNTNDEIKEVFNELEKIKVERENVHKAFEIATMNKNEKLPNQVVYREKLENAINEKIELDKIIESILEKEKSIKVLINRLENGETYLKETEDTLDKASKSLLEKNNEIESLNVDETLRQKINKGMELDRESFRLSKDVSKYKEKINDYENINLKLNKLIDEDEKLINKVSKELELAISLEEDSNNNSPGNKDDLLKLQSKISKYNEIWNKYNTYITDKNRSLLKIDEYKIDLKTLENESIDINKEFQKIKEKEEIIKINNLANELRESLKSDEACPVCGSKHHELENIKYKELVDEEIDIKIKDIESKLSTSQNNIVTKQTLLKTEEKLILKINNDIGALGDEFKSISVEGLKKEFDSLKLSIEKYEKEKDILKLKVTSLKEELSKVDLELNKNKSLLDNNKEILNDTDKELKLKELELNAINEELKSLKEELKINDFESKYREIQEKINKKIQIEKEIKELNKAKDKAIKDKDKAVKLFNDIKSDLKAQQVELKVKEDNRIAKENSLKSKLQNNEDLSSLDKLLSEVSNEIDTINKIYELLHSKKGNIDKLEKEKSEKHTALNSKLEQLTLSYNKLNKELSQLIEEAKFNGVEDIKSYLIDIDTLNLFKQEIEYYKENLIKTKGAIESLINKKGESEVSEETWCELNTKKEEINNDIEEKNKVKVSLESEINNIKAKFESLNEVVSKLNKLQKKLDILSDLEKLFKGKKFVEFVATNQLKYVSMEASKKLKDITGGNYGLEVNDDGKFLIRDYKNGGAIRDASTLSGGETFLTSLALALSLSSQIQLKGTAPLELFFLDEGFGTLDDNLLEVVMNSLEKIHNDKLKVGIISHVESIKNRVPIKLTLTQAISGQGGSKVKIERS